MPLEPHKEKDKPSSPKSKQEKAASPLLFQEKAAIPKPIVGPAPSIIELPSHKKLTNLFKEEINFIKPKKSSKKGGEIKEVLIEETIQMTMKDSPPPSEPATQRLRPISSLGGSQHCRSFQLLNNFNNFK